jgi:hypothetical protein
MSNQLTRIVLGLFVCGGSLGQNSSDCNYLASSEVESDSPEVKLTANMLPSKSVDWSPFSGGTLPYDQILRIAKHKVESENPGYTVIDPILLSLGRIVKKEIDGAGFVFGPYCWTFSCSMLSKESDEVSITVEVLLMPNGSEVDNSSK